MNTSVDAHGFENDRFKALADVMKSDSRLEELIVDGSSGGLPGKWTLEVHHAKVSLLALNERVPKDIRVSWNTARNLVLYGWFVYRFFDTACLQAAATVEFALRSAIELNTRRKCPNKRKPGLKRLLEEALKLGLIRPGDFAARQRHLDGVVQHNTMQKMIRGAFPGSMRDGWKNSTPETEENFIRRVLHHISVVRNLFAHGTFTLLGPAFESYEVMRDLINGLFVRHSTAAAFG